MRMPEYPGTIYVCPECRARYIDAEEGCQACMDWDEYEALQADPHPMARTSTHESWWVDVRACLTARNMACLVRADIFSSDGRQVWWVGSADLYDDFVSPKAAARRALDLLASRFNPAMERITLERGHRYQA
mgnify:CR=1 FL=1|jgi:hypothetical protein